MSESRVCRATAIDKNNNTKKFSVYSISKGGFKIISDKGVIKVAHPSRKLIDNDIKAEIALCYDVTEVQIYD